MFLLLACTPAPVAPALPEPHPHADAIAQLYAAAGESTVAYDRLEHLTTVIGNRISGSPELERAIDWASSELEADGFTVTHQSVMVPVWVRGDESVTLLEPEERPLAMLGLGGTVAGDVTAQVVVVRTWEELDAADVSGRIVLYDMEWKGYRDTVGYRAKGAIEASKRGAVGVLIRSVTSESLYTPHTGGLRYDPEVPAIPAAALTVEDAAWIRRVTATGQTVTVRLQTQGQTLPDRASRNTLADLPGREAPDELVVVGCHIDSWDVGQGAQDDGSGCMIAWEGARLLAASGLTPRRTVRVVLYTNEENGLAGGRHYGETVDPTQHAAVLESDQGNGRAAGFRFDLRMEDEAAQANAQARLQVMAQGLEPIGGGSWEPGYAGADIGPMAAHGVTALGMAHDTTTYWPIHHTNADTFDKIVLEDLQHNAGLMAAVLYLLAEDPAWPTDPL